jgi:deoxyribose-phosphate aldolase
MEGEQPTMTQWTKRAVAATIDHAALKPNMTDEDIIAQCELGKKYHVASVCVRPSDVALAARELAGSDVLPSMVVGFPHGAHRPEVKALEARLGIEDGAKELDMVMNIGKFLSGDFEWVRRDIEGVVAEAKKAGQVRVKVILETCYLTPAQIARACEISRDAGADYVKTSTGFGDGPATPEAIDVMIRTVGATMGVKASGGVRSYETACGYLDQGCRRLGAAGGTATIVEAAPDD